ncbi:IS66 family insertion sequence element accessory protein TnpB [Sorangium sp. So ce1097]|uniref:IS66 family insertion sequence element accessory protein TnpB n=2 Tax=Sorangium sp. So ce1097 TaxID=3133330 RepID=UPI003F62C739
MIPAGVQVFVALEPVDMRYGFERLSGLIRERVGYEARCGALFAFIGKRRTSIKILFFDGSGLCLFSNHLSSHYTSFAFRRGRWLRLRDARAAAARSLRRSQRLLCFVG